MFLKRKQGRKTKERDCANGRPQQEYITEEESSPPTVSLYTLIGSFLMDAMDNRKVITVDIQGVFLQGNWPQDKHPGYIMFEGIIVEMICQIGLSCYYKIIWSKDRKTKFLYSRLIKVVYETLPGAIIFYNKFSKHLIDPGFIQNKYNMCTTFNKIVNSEHITVQFHVDDLKVSHKKQSILDDFLKDLRDEFDQEYELIKNKFFFHKHLGITIDYLILRKVVFTMFDCLKDVIVEANEDLLFLLSLE